MHDVKHVTRLQMSGNDLPFVKDYGTQNIELAGSGEEFIAEVLEVSRLKLE